jgi:hypothetical protein
MGIRLLRAFGIDLHQYNLLRNLFSVLSDRMEFLGFTFGLNKAAGWYVFFSLMISLGAFIQQSLAGYLALVIGISMISLFMMLFVDISNSLMHPDEASVLAHQPVGGATYVAAKLTRVLQVIFVVMSSLNVIPAIAGLYLGEARWFYPLTHLMAAYLAGLFVGFMICGVYGWLFLYVSPAKLKNTALWLQLLIMFSGFSAMSLLPSLNIVVRGALKSSWMPWRWFVAVGLIGHAKYPGFSAWEAGAAFFVTLAFILFGLRGFRTDYLLNASALIQGSAAASKRSTRRSWIIPFVRRVTGAPSGSGAFSWVCIMMRRDWNFRMQTFWFMGLGLIWLAMIVITGIRTSPFAEKSFSPTHGVPHILGLLMAVACKMMSYTAEPQGSGMFVPLPLGPLKPFARGICLSPWVPVGILHLCLLGPCIWFWGAVDGTLYIGFSAALTTLYLCLAIFFIDGFPFANAFKPSIGKSLNGVILIMLIPIFIIAIIQWLIFRSKTLVLIVAVILVFLAYAAAHISLGRLRNRIHENLKLMGFGPQQIFKELE